MKTPDGTATVRVRKTVKGKRPAFHENTAVDRLIAMMMAMASEVSTLYDRLDTMERLGEAAGWLKPGAVDAYRPPIDVRTERETRREVYLERLFYILREEIEALERSDSETDYWSKIASIDGSDKS
jgi:hypothetical protein